MATFSFTKTKPVVNNKPSAKPAVKSTVKETVKDNTKKNIKVNLIHYPGQEYVPEFYTYTTADGNEAKYSGIVVTDIDGSYIGKTITTHKVILQYHPTVNSVSHVDEYFSYIDNYGRERIFTGEPKFNLETNTYFGEVTEDVLHDEIVNIYKEK